MELETRDSSDDYRRNQMIETVTFAILPRYEDIEQLFRSAASMGVPVEYIAQYRRNTGVCDLFTGTGNPDLAGVGVGPLCLPVLSLYTQANFCAFHRPWYPITCSSFLWH